MGAILSYIQITNRIEEIVNRRKYGNCYNCKREIVLNDANAYCYKILGLGKHNQKTIFQSCLKQKFIKYIV